MRYFFANLLAHFLLLVILISLVVLFTNRNIRRKTIHGIMFLLPVFLSIVTVFDVFVFTGPRLLDINDVLNKSYQSYTGELESVSYFNNIIVVDGTTYYVNPLHVMPSPGEQVRVKYTRYGKFAVQIEIVQTVEVSSSTPAVSSSVLASASATESTSDTSAAAS